MKQLKKYNNLNMNMPSLKNNHDVAAKLQVLQRLKKHSLVKMTDIHIL